MRLIPILLLSLTASTVLAHGGGLDEHGCHNDRSSGEYHCHQGDHEGKTFESKSQMLNRSGAGKATSGRSSRSSTSSQYDRDEWHPRWADHDGDCQDVREEVLIAESEIPVKFASSSECDVASGRWRDPYSGKVFTVPGRLDVDHLVPLKEAHQSGAAKWNVQRKRRYANDLEHSHTLIAVEAGENRSKGSRDPAEWMPSNQSFHCDYVERWISVKREWDLKMDASEERAIERFQMRCR